MDTEKGINDQSIAATAPERYSVFTRTEKWCIVSMVAYAAWFSTLSSFIYYPALQSLSAALNITIAQADLTVTTYMAVATIAPSLVGDAADVLGRRPMYLITLTLYVAANLAIALTKSYSALLGLRVLQALAISGTIDRIISCAAKRGFCVLMSSLITIAPSIGPIIGGALTYAAGWPWIFWFLGIAAGLCVTVMALFLPETSRSIVGNGSIRPAKHLRLPVPGPLMCHWQESRDTAPHIWRVPNPLKSLVILGRKDNAVIILACGLLYAVYTCINASLSTLFIDIYGLNQWQAGIIYLPFGVGGTVSTFFSGPLLNTAYRNARAKQGLSTDKAGGDDLDNFAIEKARLVVIWVPMLLTALSVYNTLLVDKNHRSPAAAQASSNIVRCTLAAVSVSFPQNLLDALGIGKTFTFMAGLCLVATGLFLIDYKFGTLWRQKCTVPIPPPQDESGHS
ncbi:hypothetical protein SLS62_001399 [Diatrype stigma]|uniref:Major facilitator superfamily (MFS) profile domain-containing protein n=1 Tax=Diatrype stigma TaxID=117547 RepID=A0AAN9V0Z5_9PEZI